MSPQSLEGDDYLSVLEKVVGKVLVGVKKGSLEEKVNWVHGYLDLCI